jgi:signal transduction histidine kinase
MIEGDPQRLRQAIMNLVENAVEFTPSAGSVTVSSWRMGAEAGITVADTGAGIPDSDQARVFDRFYRVDPSRSRQTGGSGLGLAICYEIATAHGGRIWVQSEVGSGSRFSIGLPAVGGSAPASDEPAAQPRVPVLPPR